MSSVIFLYLAPVAAILSCGTAIFIWHERKQRGAIYLMISIILATVSLTAACLELIDSDLSRSLIWADLGFVFSNFTPLAWLAFIFEYVNYHDWLKPQRFLKFALIPLFSILVALMDGMYHLVFASYHLENINSTIHAFQIDSYGVWFIVQTLYSYGLMLFGAILIIVSNNQMQTLFRKQSLLVIVAAVSPMFANFVYLMGLFPFIKQDFSPLFFATASVIYTFGVLRYQLFSLMPIAHSMLVQKMTEGMLVLDLNHQVVDVNPAALNIMGYSHARELVGRSINELPGIWKDIVELADNRSVFHTEVSIPVRNELLYYEVHIIRLQAQQTKSLGYLATMHDITERVKLMHEIQKAAHFDPLVGLYNRRHFYEVAQHEYDRACRYNHPLSLLMLDIDHFKQVNDLNGHVAGDTVLCEFSKALKSSLRSMDIAARFGGDEFIVLLPETGPHHAKQLAERLLREIKATPIRLESGILSLTFSVGISTLESNEETLESLIERADRALYHSKVHGRDRISLIMQEN